MADIIDLRKKQSAFRQDSAQGVEKGVILEWSAQEYEKRQRSTSWYVGISTVAVLLVAFGIVTRSYFFTLFTALAYAILMMYEKRTPSEFNFSISTEGVKAGKTLHKFSELKSFWVFRREGSSSAEQSSGAELSLEGDKILSPYLRIPLQNIDPERVRRFLLNYLPEEEHQEFITDRIERNL